VGPDRHAINRRRLGHELVERETEEARVLFAGNQRPAPARQRPTAVTERGHRQRTVRVAQAIERRPAWRVGSRKLGGQA
jgi:hypothetical protein